jgi:hypothetical protein
MTTRTPLTLFVAAVLLVGACSAGGGAPSPSTEPAPTPTPIAVDIATPDDAAALVIATDPRFAGTIKLDPNLIGASRWWESAPLGGGGFRITVTIGWGDCPAGCISRHLWTYQVTADGQVSLESQSGDPLPEGSIPPG